MTPVVVSPKWKQNYDAQYVDYTDWRWIGSQDKFANLAKLCSNVPHHRVLEIGSGEGALLKRMEQAEFAEELYSLEISESSVSAVQSLALKRLRQATLFDGYTTPFGDKSFDLVVLSHVVEHVEHPRMLIAEAARIGRYIFVEVPLEDNVRLTYNYSFTPLGHINYYSPKTIRRLLQSCDLQVLHQHISANNISIYTYRLGVIRGTLAYTVKRMLLLSPAVATQLFTYHCALLATSQ
jgi:SAM-dependent methyltransferase